MNIKQKKYHVSLPSHLNGERNGNTFRPSLIYLVTLGLFLVLSSCNKTSQDPQVVYVQVPGESQTIPSSPAPSPIPTEVLPSVPVCNTKLIDPGQKGSVATTTRGTYSDVKMLPGTNSPVAAYVDASAISIKLSYWSNNSFQTEVVSGDGTATFLKLNLLSNGIPIVLWTLGANLKAAIRTAPIGQPGTWSGGIIDTGVAPRAVEVAVSPQDQIAVTFLTDTATTGRAKFLYCDAPCTSTSSFQTMSGSPWIENTNIVSAETNTGVAWCKSSSSTYYPMAVYSVTGATRYAVCLNTLPNCLAGTNWVATTVVATANLSSKLLVDSSVVGDVPKVISLGASGLIPYKMGTTPCTSTPAAFTAGSTMGTATSGSQWMSFLKDNTGKFHLIANEGTTAVKYYNSASTDLVAAWNAPGTVDTVTLAGATGGGADIDASTSGIYVSYGQNALPYDFKLGRVKDYTQASSGASFSRLSPDASGDIQLSAAGAQLKNVSVASNSQQVPGVAYIDFSIGAVANAKLKFALRSGPSSTSPWIPYLVPNAINPQFPSLAFDNNNRPWIGYFDAAINRFYLTTNSSSDGSGSWSTYEFPSIPSGAPVALPAANNTALGMFIQGNTTSPFFVVIDTNATSKGIKVAILNPLTGNWSSPQTIDGLVSGALGAAHLAADYDSHGTLVVAYQELNVGRVRYSSSSDGITWTLPLSISGVNQGQGLSIKLNPASGKPTISYYDQVNNAVYINSCSLAPSACASGGWTAVQVEAAAGVSTLAANASQVLSTALNFTSSGSVFLFYPRGSTNGGDLILLQNLTGSFSPLIASSGVLGNLPGAPAFNFGVTGWDVASAPNAVGYFTTVFVGPGNRLFAASCGD